MQRDHVLAILAAHRQAMQQRFGIKSLAVFGSLARDEARVDSDVDILVEFDGTPSFDRYMGLLIFLEDLLGCRVDLAMPTTLKPRIRPQIEKEAVHVAGL